MVEHKLSLDVYEEVRSRRQASVAKSPAPAPGTQLRRAVNAALCELSAAADLTQLDVRHVDDLLVGGLAWAAATGDTCRIESAVHAARVARVRLGAADPNGARTALLAALDGLDDSAADRRSGV